MVHWITISGQEYLVVEPGLLFTHKDVVEARTRYTKKKLELRVSRGN